MIKEGRMGYNSQNDRFGLLINDLWEIEGFHCGEAIDILVNGEWLHTRVEMQREKGKNIWYLVDTPYKGDDLEGLHIRIE